jgi:hypothetical protein
VRRRTRPKRANALLQLGQNLFDVPFVRESVDDLEFGELDVDRVVVLAEEDFNVVLEDEWPPLYDEMNVSERDVLDFVAGREKGDYERVQVNTGLDSRQRPLAHQAADSISDTSPPQPLDFPCNS